MGSKLKETKKYHWIYAAICVAVFLILLFCNLRTPLLVDDYLYSFSFQSLTGEKQRIETVSDIFSSMSGHRLTMNGRIVANFFVQLFLLLPSSLFKLLNAAVFVLELALITELSAVYIPPEKIQKRKPLMLLFAFAAVWIFQPVFGQVNLWLYGSINYLWAAVLGLGLMGIYLKMYREEDFHMNLPEKIGFIIYSFVVGTWCENSGAALLVFEIVLIFLMKFQQKRKIPLVAILSAEITLAGVLLTITAPAELKNRTASLMLGDLLSMLSDLFSAFKDFWLLWLLVGLLLVWAFCVKVDKQTLIVVSLVVMTALLSGLFLIFGNSITANSLFFTAVLLVLACCILINVLFDSLRMQILCVLCLTCLAFPYYFFTGVNDINTCYYTFMNNEQEIKNCAEAGKNTVEIYYVYPDTKYTASYGLQYVEQPDSDSWTNNFMAAYYGVEVVSPRVE